LIVERSGGVGEGHVWGSPNGHKLLVYEIKQPRGSRELSPRLYFAVQHKALKFIEEGRWARAGAGEGGGVERSCFDQSDSSQVDDVVAEMNVAQRFATLANARVEEPEGQVSAVVRLRLLFGSE